MNKYLFSVFLILWAGSAAAASDRVYLSPMEDSKWVLSENSVLNCSIEHVIPRFGKAVFYQESGRSLKLKFISSQQYKKDLTVSFRSVTASWKGIHTEANLASLKTSGGNPLVNIVDSAARQAYFELQQGFQPSLFFIDDDDGFNSVVVVLSTVNFRDVEASFNDCLSRLYPDNFDDVKQAVVHFDFDEEFPKEEEEERALKRMLNYLKVDKGVTTIMVSGNTDYKGSECYNETLSARRAWYIYDYLVQSGVDPKKLRIKFYGENNPLVKGKSEKARALNRRVEVTLKKELD